MPLDGNAQLTRIMHRATPSSPRAERQPRRERVQRPIDQQNEAEEEQQQADGQEVAHQERVGNDVIVVGRQAADEQHAEQPSATLRRVTAPLLLDGAYFGLDYGLTARLLCIANAAACCLERRLEHTLAHEHQAQAEHHDQAHAAAVAGEEHDAVLRPLSPNFLAK